MSTEGLTNEEFMQELHKYKVVRSSNSIINIKDSEEEEVVRPNIKSVHKKPRIDDDEIMIDMDHGGNGFYDKLRDQIRVISASPIIAEAITQSFQDVQQGFINSLSLDNIERISILLNQYKDKI